MSENSAGRQGGGIDSANASLTLNNLTIVGNASTAAGAGLRQSSIQQPTVGNSIIANNTDGSSAAHDCDGTIVSQGYNLIEDTGGCTIGGDSDGGT